jgi:Cys-tRNA(Pro)/Cys-tRNA(Cys) deacylase
VDDKQYGLKTGSSVVDTMNMNLEEYLKQNSVWHRFVDKPETIHTKDAALHTGIDLERITKSLVFLADGKPVLVVVPGNSRVDMGKLRDLTKTRDVVLVSFEKAREYSGYDPGATPPINHKNITLTIIEKRLCDYKTIYGGGGVRNKLIELRPEDVIRLSEALIANVVE